MSEPAAAAPLLRVCSPADLVELVPYLVGFHPKDSVVFISLHGPRERVGLTLRLDLAAAMEDLDSLNTCAAHLARSGARAVVVVVYSRGPTYWFEDGTPSLPHSDLVLELADALRLHNVVLADALLVADERWWSYLCLDPMCCTPEGHDITDDGTVSAVAAAATVAGMTVVADRDALVQSLAPLPEPDRADLAARCRQLAETWEHSGGRPSNEEAAQLWSNAVLAQRHSESPLDWADAAALLVLLQDAGVRDACTTWATGPDTGAARALTRQLARRASPPWDVAPYALLAWYAWRGGDGALSRIAVEFALASDPKCAFALLIQQLIDYGVDPRAWRDPPHMGGGGGPRL